MDNSIQHLNNSLNWAFIDQKLDSLDEYRPKLLVNNKDSADFVLTPFLEELDRCRSFTFSVAFITESGLAMLKSHLADLKARGITGKILTSNYLNFNQPKIYKELLKITNVEVRLTELNGFHSKGYVFEHEGYSTIIMGSSNLTAAALKANYEWNVKLTSYQNGGLLEQFQKEFDKVWTQAVPLTDKWIDAYQIFYEEVRKANQRAQEALPFVAAATVPQTVFSSISPNKMQQSALTNLQTLRSTGASRGMVISATGTGKTFLSAFDVRNFKPKRMLFVVHREQILHKAMTDYQRIIGGEDRDYGILSGNRNDLHAKYLFATVQTISKSAVLEGFDPEAFDYILIDEVHKAGASSYLKIIDHFKPKFLLGMTATPERTDDFNLYELFDYNIAYEIRLQEALEEDMLCPFHYFGVTDFEFNGRLIDDTSMLSQLVTNERVSYLIEKIQYYGYSGETVKGLIFCSRKEEAIELSQMLNERGYKTVALTGSDSQEERSRRVTELEDGDLDYILTVDIFNEGIDIPCVNQVVMLRQTQSSIIFVQQLGRGLRKHANKEFVTIIDFIGNYKNNYLIPIALSGDKSQNKDNIRRYMKDTSYIRGVSTINFEEVARQQIYRSIGNSNLTALKILREAYQDLKNRLNRIPNLMDFMNNDSIDPMIFADEHASYYHFLQKIKETVPPLTEQEQKYLVMLSAEVLNGKRMHEIVLLDLLGSESLVTSRDYTDKLAEVGCSMDSNVIDSVKRVLDMSFFTEATKKKYGELPIVEFFEEQQCFKFHPTMAGSLRNNPYFKEMVTDILQTAMYKSSQYAANKPLTMYKKYSRKESCKLLNWHSDESSTMYGYKTKYQTCPIFVTYHKHEGVEASTNYQEEFINSQVLKWSTRSRRTLQSEEVKVIVEADQLSIDLHVFVKKDDAEGTEFYYLGKAHPDPESAVQASMINDTGESLPVVHMNLVLEHAVEDKLYNYLTKS
ncbi:DEAD/DEAH box helicase [Paenibacillus sp. JX-17]|uniref:DEAD/DEAH box helicase n=1 Tax=Paenibacillus lacisoli TaxID=3064525 RepID=A0ABT9CG80_9BACL|nr:DEAD/DEAH box helicase [Paenibacillus sp. JX-17]MDO7907583.1 DEAD/DEAH box helicase [Paenibacillus sp. JX-17]